MTNKIILPGQKFGRLATSEYDKSQQKWLCKCDCGNEKYVSAGHLRDGHAMVQDSPRLARRQTTSGSKSRQQDNFQKGDDLD